MMEKENGNPYYGMLYYIIAFYSILHYIVVCYGILQVSCCSGFAV